jgi:hypothetical protein
VGSRVFEYAVEAAPDFRIARGRVPDDPASFVTVK